VTNLTVGEPGQALGAQPPSRRRRIDPAVLAAIIVGTLGLIGVLVRLVSGILTTHSPVIGHSVQPSITVVSPVPNQHIGRVIRVTGTVRNLHGHVVMLYVEFVQPDGTSSGSLYPFGKPCLVTQKHVWTCTGVKVGSTKAYGDQFFIWAAVVTGAQEAADLKSGASPIGPDALSLHAGGPTAVYKRLVTRCAKDQSCSG
jgi:hypothetical protein